MSSSHNFLHVMFPSPHPGIINFFSNNTTAYGVLVKFPSPHPGIINFFPMAQGQSILNIRFRPLIRGLSISSQIRLAWLKAGWGFRPLIRGLSISSTDVCRCRSQPRRFRPLIRGLSISSDILCPANLGSVVSVPSSGDYQFLLGTVVLGAAIG